MEIQIEAGVRIENPRDYSSQVVEQLRHLLAAGTSAQQDPRREHFYEIETASETYYIHISPISGHVVLLAKWLRESQDCCLSAGNLVA